MVVSGSKEDNIKEDDELKHQVSQSNSLKVPLEKYQKRERKVDRMRTLLETIEHVNVTLPFVAALEHDPIYLKFTNKFLVKQRELREIEEARRMVCRQTSHREP